ncbi:MAG: hypothetical protein ACI4EG_03160 [Fusicatenibacter sp.]
MKKQNKQTKYPLDNSGIIHLAVLKNGCSNSFRISVTLTREVDPQLLQEALNIVTPRFPTMIAGIDSGFFRHWVVPVQSPPTVQPDCSLLAYMPPEQIQNCGMRVLYRNTQIAVEFFHSLTDGFGGIQFLKALLAVYLKLAYGVECSESEELIVPGTPMEPAEVEDSYSAYAGKQKMKLNHTASYQMTGAKEQSVGIHVTTLIFPLEKIRQTAHDYHVTITTFLTAVMAASIMDLQIQQISNHDLKPVQVMVPVNLRKLFPSRSLRNFSLYALPCIQPGDEQLPLENLLKRINDQLKEQLSRDFLHNMISTNVGLEHNWLFRRLPLKIKCAGLRIAFPFFGARNSSISLSNIGELTFPETMRFYIRRAEIMLTPRLSSPYNCGIASSEGRMYINFTRSSSELELERIFIKRTSELGIVPSVEVDGTAIGCSGLLTEGRNIDK